MPSARTRTIPARSEPSGTRHDRCCGSPAARISTTRALDGVRGPVLLLHGRRDRLVPARYAEEVLRRYPTWRGRIFPDLGHVAQMEAPGRWIAEVADWYSSIAPR